MQRIFVSMSLIGLGLLTSGCMTREYSEARQQCSPEAYQLYPEQFYQGVELRSRWVKVPRGHTCTSSTNGNTSTTRCEDVLEDELIQTPEPVTKDLNQGPRDQYLNQCARQLCYKRYGNPQCNTNSR